MSKSKFFEEVEEIINNGAYSFSEEALAGFKELKDNNRRKGVGLTESGEKILQYMQSTIDKYNNEFKAAEIGEGMQISGRSVSGSMRKLIDNNYVRKISEKPVKYELTDFGKNYSFDK